jgi:universal stress protein F
MYKKIIVAVEIGALADGEMSLRKAATLLDTGGGIILLNVVEEIPTYVAVDLPVDIVEGAAIDAREKLQALIVTTGIPAMVEISHGRPATGILASADAHDADLMLRMFPTSATTSSAPPLTASSATPNARYWSIAASAGEGATLRSRRFIRP